MLPVTVVYEVPLQCVFFIFLPCCTLNMCLMCHCVCTHCARVFCLFVVHVPEHIHIVCVCVRACVHVCVCVQTVYVSDVACINSFFLFYACGCL